MARMTRYMFEICGQNTSFSRFIAVFSSYCPKFWVSIAIYNDLKARYMFQSYDKKLMVFVFFDRFNELLPTDLGFQADLHGSYDSLHVLEI